MDSQMITTLHFSDIYHGLRKCQERMKKMFDREKVHRFRSDEGFVYYLDDKPGQAEHLLALNWVRVWFVSQLKSWEKLHCFVYEDDYKFIRPDAFVAIKNSVTGEFRFFYVELDRTHSNDFNPKIKRYERLLKELNKGSVERWWVKLTEKMPLILVVTTTPQRKEKILRQIQEANKERWFDVRLLCDLRREVVRK